MIFAVIILVGNISELHFPADFVKLLRVSSLGTARGSVSKNGRLLLVITSELNFSLLFLHPGIRFGYKLKGKSQRPLSCWPLVCGLELGLPAPGEGKGTSNFTDSCPPLAIWLLTQANSLFSNKNRGVTLNLT